MAQQFAAEIEILCAGGTIDYDPRPNPKHYGKRGRRILWFCDHGSFRIDFPQDSPWGELKRFDSVEHQGSNWVITPPARALGTFKYNVDVRNGQYSDDPQMQIEDGEGLNVKAVAFMAAGATLFGVGFAMARGCRIPCITSRLKA